MTLRHAEMWTDQQTDRQEYTHTLRLIRTDRKKYEHKVKHNEIRTNRQRLTDRPTLKRAS